MGQSEQEFVRPSVHIGGQRPVLGYKPNLPPWDWLTHSRGLDLNAISISKQCEGSCKVFSHFKGHFDAIKYFLSFFPQLLKCYCLYLVGIYRDPAIS